jgi:DNA-binding NtrC family response regulator
MSLDDRIDQACAAVGAVEIPIAPKSVFHVELREALWMAIEGGMALAEILGEVRREAAEIAIEQCGGKYKAARKLQIGRQTLRNIETRTNKY